MSILSSSMSKTVLASVCASAIGFSVPSVAKEAAEEVAQVAATGEVAEEVTQDAATEETVEDEARGAAKEETVEGGAQDEVAEESMTEPHDESSAMVQEVEGMIDSPTDENHKKVFDAFRARLPGVAIESLSDGPYPGLYEIITNSQVIYVDEAVSLLFQGDLIDLNTGTNLTEARLSGIHMGLIDEMGEENMLVYKSETPSDRNITVFTDINCGYCRLLHGEIDTLLEGGVNVRYLMFPRAGLQSDSATALESVWCADDPQAAMTSAKAGNPIEQKSCTTPMEQHYALAEQVGLRGTPLIYLDNGTAIPGYREAKILVEMINSTEPQSE